ncbi:MAG: hypothetical protein AAGA92_02950 [Planctomycetota bacterium]
MNDLEHWKSHFGYTSHWFDLGFLTDDFVARQALEYETGPNKDVEHYKWAGYLEALSQVTHESQSRFRDFMGVLEADPNEHLPKGAIAYLLDNCGIPTEWFYEFKDSPLLTARSVRDKLGIT